MRSSRRQARLAALALSLCAAALAPSFCQPAAAPPQGQIISLSLVEVLVAIEATDLAGIFGFIPEASAPMAMADYLTHDHKALKRFLKKCDKDYRDAQGINDWDKQVLLYLVGLDASGAIPLGAKKIPEGLMKRVSELSLLPGLPLQMIVQRRAK